mmetsp:Transcript_8036/g.10499  ORF Transcript_8036/g.10499 Transcript_8036/m.10499 type:complete len:159 (+) Transcript_8036:644-1120(+)
MAKCLKSDIWALGITLLILSVGVTKYASLNNTNGFYSWENVLEGFIYDMNDEDDPHSSLLQYLEEYGEVGDNIVSALKRFSILRNEFYDFLGKSLTFNRINRAGVDELLKVPFITSNNDVAKHIGKFDGSSSDESSKLYEPIKKFVGNEYTAPNTPTK